MKLTSSYGMPCPALISLKQRCSQYLNNPNIVFKSCVYSNYSLIIVLQRLEDTITNEDRNDVLRPLSAKFRGNRFLVLDIIDKFTHKSYYFIFTFYDSKQFFYVKGNIVSIYKYTKDDFVGKHMNKVCWKGIHFFKSIERAFYHDLSCVENGDHWSFYDNGFPIAKYTYSNNKIVGYAKMWNRDGTEFVPQKYVFKKTWYEYFFGDIHFVYDK
jgi:hypothetical protein